MHLRRNGLARRVHRCGAGDHPARGVLPASVAACWRGGGRGNCYGTAIWHTPCPYI